MFLFNFWLFFINSVLAGTQFSSSSSIIAIFNEKIAAGDVNELQSIIDKNPKYFQSSVAKMYRNKGVLLAVQKRHAPIVELLLKKANVDAAIKNNAAIRFSSANGDAEIVRMLLTRPEVNPGAINNEALLVATKKGHTEVVRLLLAHPRVKSSARNYEAVFWASELRHADIVKLLVQDERDFPINIGFHILKRTAQSGNLDLARFLLNHPSFSQIVHLVVISGNLLSLRTLVEAGYKIDEETLERSLRHARSIGNEDIVKYLESLKGPPKLPTRPFVLMTEQCAICLSDENLLEGFTTSCNHQFHMECLQSWITKQNSCPICRTSIV